MPRAVTVCPADDELVLMVEGVLAHEVLARIESHLGECTTCASVVANLGALGASAPPDHTELAAVDSEHYAIMGEVARGGMGRILRARDRRLGREVAIKENFVRTGETARRFERDVRITARLQHPSLQASWVLAATSIRRRTALNPRPVHSLARSFTRLIPRFLQALSPSW